MKTERDDNGRASSKHTFQNNEAEVFALVWTVSHVNNPHSEANQHDRTHGRPEDDREPNKEGYVNVLDRDSFAGVQCCLAIAVERIERVVLYSRGDVANLARMPPHGADMA